MRSTDDLNSEPPFKPLGEKVTKVEKRKPTQTEWTAVPGAPPGIERDEHGRFRTNIPENDKCR